MAEQFLPKNGNRYVRQERFYRPPRPRATLEYFVLFQRQHLRGTQPYGFCARAAHRYRYR